jgi:dienelactone hydrolase
MLWHPDIDTIREPHRVLIRRDAFVDPAREGRRVPFKFYYPETDGDLPLVLWSHGLGGSADGASFLARFIASHGYIVVNMQHPGTDSSLWEGKPGHPWDVIRATKIERATVLDRFRDVPFVLDSLPAWLEAHRDIPARPDYTRIGMSGHSFGALTTQVMAGQMFPDENDALQSFREPRFRAGILYSPVPSRHLTDADEAALYGPMNLPLLFMTGTADESPIEGFGPAERMAVFEHAGGRDQNLMIIDDADHMVFAGSRGKLTGYPKIPLHETIIKTVALAWWEAWLKDDKTAHAWFTQGGVNAWLKDEAVFKGRV